MKNFSKSDNKWGFSYVCIPTGIAEKATIIHRFRHYKKEDNEALGSEGENPGDEEAEKRD